MPSQLNRLTVAGALLGLLCFGLTACKKPFADRDQKNPVYRHSSNGAPVSIDPASASTLYENEMVTTVYD